MASPITTERIGQDDVRRLPDHDRDLDHAREVVLRQGVDPEAVLVALGRFSLAAPSWALGTGGTRFGRFAGGGEPRCIEEKVDDVATLNALTGANRTISLHVPWDDPDDPAALRAYVTGCGLGFDCMNSNTFQDNPSTTREGEISYKFGSLCHTDPAVRRAAIEHNRHVVEVGEKLGSKALLVWLADGTNHPGQASFRRQFERTLESLREIYAALPEDWRIFTEHKPYEPAFYSTVNADWGTSLLLALGMGERAACIVDLGHHLPNTNIEQVVSRLAAVKRLGGFHFNDAKYGDDDLTVGSIHPYQLFLVFSTLLEHGDGSLPQIAYMIDQSNNCKDPLEDLIQATTNAQVALAQALCLNRPALEEAQSRNDAALAEELLHQAFRTDVRPLTAEARRRNGAALDPLAMFRAAGYRRAMIKARGESSTATGL